MTSPHSLESVTAAFNDWRQQQSTPRGRIPVALQTQAVALLSSHPISHVIKSLKINHTTLKRWQQWHTTEKPCEFVPLVPEEQPTAHVALRNAYGGECIITGLTLAQITILALQFTASSGESQ